MTASKTVKIGAILLAAGGSSRFGRPKQLVEFEGKTLIRRGAETLANSTCDPIVVVLGAEIERSAMQIADFSVCSRINENWQDGMSTSIIAGLNFLLEIEPDLDAVIITLCDQPLVSTGEINRLIETYQDSHAAIVAARYEGTMGVPALFSRSLFDELLALKGDTGARQLIRKYAIDVEPVTMEKAAFDIDTIDDVDRLITN